MSLKDDPSARLLQIKCLEIARPIACLWLPTPAIEATPLAHSTPCLAIVQYDLEVPVAMVLV